MKQHERIDPVCGMQGTIYSQGHYFCSQHCVDVYKKQQIHYMSAEPTDSKLPAILLVSFLVLGMLASFLYSFLMLPFMGTVLILLSILKLLDLRGFADAYAMYDLIARQIPLYGLVYPFVELGLGLLFLFQMQVQAAAMILAVLMVIGIVSVVLELQRGRKLQCACMGTKIKVPLTTLTLTEDIIMLLMAVMLLR